MKLAIGILIVGIVAFAQDNVIRIDTALRELIVTVRDDSGHLVSGLTAENFRIEQDGTLQTIAHFSADAETPVSVGILIDTRQSMQMLADIDKEIGAMRILVRSVAKEGDEFSLMTFSDSLKIMEPFTADTVKVDRTMRTLYPDDLTPGRLNSIQSLRLFEGIRRALVEMKRSKRRERALVIATEAYSENNLDGFLQEIRSAEIPIFIIGFGGAYMQMNGVPSSVTLTAQSWERMAFLKGEAAEVILTKIADESGGRSEMFILDRNNPVDRIIAFTDEIAAELRGQYRLGYYLKNSNESVPHVIQVKTDSPVYKVGFHPLPLTK